MAENTLRVVKWGNSLAVRLPKQLADKFGWKAGTDLDIVAAKRPQTDGEKKSHTKAQRTKTARR